MKQYFYNTQNVQKTKKIISQKIHYRQEKEEEDGEGGCSSSLLVKVTQLR